MSKSDLIEEVKRILSENKTGVLSTVEHNRPHSRYMTFYHQDLTLYTPTKYNTEKIEEIQKNPSVSVLLGFEGKGLNDTYVEVLGNTTVNQFQDVKEKFWDESFNKWFNGPEDEEYVLLQIQPEIIRILNNNDEPPRELII